MRYLRRFAMAAVAIAIFVFAWFFRFNDPNGGFAGLTDDHFYYLLRGWQILYGELPFRDFVDAGAPLYFYVSAAVQLLFGRGTLSELAFSTTLIALASALTFWLAARASGSIWLGVLGALFQILLLPRFYNYPKLLVYTAAIPLLWWFADRPGRRPLAWLAVVTVVGFLLRHDHGAFVAVAVAATLLLASHVPWTERARYAVFYGAVSLALVSPYLLFIQLNGGLGEYRRQATEWVAEERARTPVQWPGLFDNPGSASADAREGMAFTRAVGVVRDNRVAWLYYFEITLPILVILLIGLSRDGFRPAWPHARQKIAVVAVLGLVLDAGFLRSPLQARVADPSVPHAILIAWLAAAMPRMLSTRSSWTPAAERWIVPARVLVLAATVAAAFVLAAIFTNRIYNRLEDAYLTEGPRVALARSRTVSEGARRDWDLSTWTTREDRSGLMTLALYLNTCTPPDARVFVQPYLPQVLGMARRGFAAGFGDLRPGFFDDPEFEALALRRMRGQDVPVVLLDVDDSLESFRESFPTLTAYFDAAYDRIATQTFDDRFGVTLLVKRGRQGGTFDLLGWPCPAVPAG
jgi:hypothetical protein